MFDFQTHVPDSTSFWNRSYDISATHSQTATVRKVEKLMTCGSYKILITQVLTSNRKEKPFWKSFCVVHKKNLLCSLEWRLLKFIDDRWIRWIFLILINEKYSVCEFVSVRFSRYFIWIWVYVRDTLHHIVYDVGWCFPNIGLCQSFLFAKILFYTKVTLNEHLNVFCNFLICEQ